ncbi:glutathionylspermidine synthase family protein [Bradyrhizobium sp.]|uniref:glutathionylspermidine synthase family protein n=1 Tax=Bradyrhizobium sp. TaxID=376 RepID=UPI003C22951A
MQRIPCRERDDWQATAEACGFDFHTIDGVRYWDERAFYAFTLAEIEDLIEAPTGEIDAMCRELCGSVVEDERHLKRLRIPEAFWPLIRDSWRRHDGSLYGRLDLSYGGSGAAKLLEYNADTPTSIFEAAVFQWTWLEQAIERRLLEGGADQFNSLHERLIEAWKKLGAASHLHLAGMLDNPEDLTTLTYLEDTAKQAGLETTLLAIESIGWREPGGFVGLDDETIALAFKLYPWEWMFHDAFGEKLAGASTRWIEPPWKAILSNKGLLALLWEMFPGHPNLLPAFFEDEPGAKTLSSSFVRKPLLSREGANIAIVRHGDVVASQQGPYGAEGYIRQALAPLPNFSGQYPVLGSWLVDHVPCGLSIREDENPITGNTSRFLPHAIL